MLNLTEHELSEEYNIHYSIYKEGDSTESEIRTFFLLNPVKSGTYLNYGAGKWSKTISTLRKDGWNIYGYDPNKSSYNNPPSDFFITSLAELSNKKYNGIFSNNVLEHFRNPIKELNIMKKLLHYDGLMSHATPCFQYLYEFTRFHLFFYTGKSKAYIADKADLVIVHEVKDNDFNAITLKSK